MGDPTTRSLARERGDRPICNPESAADRRVRTEAIASNIATRLGMCSLDELRVLDVILGRLEKGREDYGYLELDGDPRNWRDEAAEELVDLAIYDACDRIARRDEQLERLRCEAADEIARANPVERGLAELRDAEAVTTPRPLLEFDMPDDGLDEMFDTSELELGGEGG